MVYALVLGTSVERHASSSLALGTNLFFPAGHQFDFLTPLRYSFH